MRELHPWSLPHRYVRDDGRNAENADDALQRHAHYKLLATSWPLYGVQTLLQPAVVL